MTSLLSKKSFAIAVVKNKEKIKKVMIKNSAQQHVYSKYEANKASEQFMHERPKL